MASSKKSRKKGLLRRPLGILRSLTPTAADKRDPSSTRAFFRRREKPEPPVEEQDDMMSVEESSMVRNTHVMTVQEQPLDPNDDLSADDTMLLPAGDMAIASPRCCNTTAILQHSYMEMLCGASSDAKDEERCYQHKLPDDPTVQESIECVFASQLEEGIPLLDDSDEEGDVALNQNDEQMLSPSVVHQSLLKSRSSHERSTSPPNSSHMRKRRIGQKLVHVGSYTSSSSSTEAIQIQDERKPLCACARQHRPLLPPHKWPQRPLLLRPTPNSGTRIRGVRFAGETTYLWEPSSSCEDKLWKELDTTCMCEYCMVLPINNGNEEAGRALVTDFESELFEGTLLLRIRHCNSRSAQPYDDTKGYFAGLNRRYQCVVSGRFRKPLPLTRCVTGLQLARKCGKLPSKWIVKGAIKVIGFFAPQMDVDLDSDKPKSLSPLGSTPQCISVEDTPNAKLDDVLEEPKDASATLLGKASTAASSMQRARYRKKAFDKLYVQKSAFPTADTSQTYTFEFLQHLFNFQEFSIELGSMLGSVDMKDMLYGQPMQLMASSTCEKNPLWSFDLWHESLYADAEICDAQG